MRTFLALLAVGWLSAGTSSAQTPEEILALAGEKTELCQHIVERFEGSQWVQVKGKTGEKIARLSPSTILRPGRFNLIGGVDTTEVGGRTAFIIHFVPVPEKRQLKASSGEDEDYIRGINNLSGDIFIDKASGEVMGVMTSLTKPLRYFYYLLPWYLTGLEITFGQREQDGELLPDSFELTATGRAFKLTSSTRYRARFNCAEGAAATKPPRLSIFYVICSNEFERQTNRHLPHSARAGESS